MSSGPGSLAHTAESRPADGCIALFAPHKTLPPRSMSSSAVHASPATSPSPSAVHEVVCEFVAAQAEAEAEAG